MLKTILLTLLALLIAIGGGAASVWAVLEKAPPFGTVEVGSWTATPQLGVRDTDPYTKATFSREGGIPLGQAEGMTFTATQDSVATPLERNCTYRLQGPFPPARAWTLYAVTPNEELLPSFGQRRAALHSGVILRRDDNGFTITISPHPEPGNWLATTGTGPMQLVLTLFDTPIPTNIELIAPQLPSITRVGCDV